VTSARVADDTGAPFEGRIAELSDREEVTACPVEGRVKAS
jgi:hypothetical protein